MTLFVDQANYMSQFTKMAGYKIVINEQGLMTFPYEEGINVPPGVFASIGMRKVRFFLSLYHSEWLIELQNKHKLTEKEPIVTPLQLLGFNQLMQVSASRYLLHMVV